MMRMPFQLTSIDPPTLPPSYLQFQITSNKPTYLPPPHAEAEPVDAPKLAADVFGLGARGDVDVHLLLSFVGYLGLCV